MKNLNEMSATALYNLGRGLWSEVWNLSLENEKNSSILMAAINVCRKNRLEKGLGWTGHSKVLSRRLSAETLVFEITEITKALNEMKFEEPTVEEIEIIETPVAVVEAVAAAEFRYTYKFRGYSISCQPKEGFVRVEDGNPYQTIIYNRELTADEIDNFDLIDLNKIIYKVVCKLDGEVVTKESDGKETRKHFLNDLRKNGFTVSDRKCKELSVFNFLYDNTTCHRSCFDYINSIEDCEKYNEIGYQHVINKMIEQDNRRSVPKGIENLQYDKSFKI